MASISKKKRASSLKRVKEKSVLNTAMQVLALHKISHWRMNSGALKTQCGHFVRFGAKGMPDLYAIGKDGISIWIECKRPVGGVLSESQKNFLDCINRNGGIGIVVNSVESLEEQLREAGII